MNLIEIQTTAYDEENFILVTDLTSEEIEKVIAPMKEEEYTTDGIFYSNEDYATKLSETYPNNNVIFYTKDTIDYLEI
jgi:hypothetical protein